MPDVSYYQTRPPDRFTQLFRLIQARATGHVTQAEFDQHMDWWLGLNMLNGKTVPTGRQADNLITRRLWAGLWLPLGIEREEGGERRKEKR